MPLRCPHDADQLALWSRLPTRDARPLGYMPRLRLPPLLRRIPCVRHTLLVQSLNPALLHAGVLSIEMFGGCPYAKRLGTCLPCHLRARWCALLTWPEHI